MKIRLTLTIDIDMSKWMKRRGNVLDTSQDARDEVKRELCAVVDAHLDEFYGGKVIRLH